MTQCSAQTSNTPPILSVSEFNQQVRRLLEVSFPAIWIEGEISNLTKHTSGHWYFSLKDEKSQVRCAMFKGHNRLTRFSPENGMQILVKANASLYPARGDFQLVVHHMEEAGAGALQRAFELLKQKLLQEGLFDAQRKKTLPAFPKHIGVISSPTGAVIRDICAVLKRRCPLINVTLLPATVQGKEAPSQLIKMLKLAETAFEFDALILARGGGSLEDLQPFNEESVARAMAACTLPLVSSIGHETDTTIADYVADYRAPTPSAAAEMLSPDQRTWQIQIKQKEATLYRTTLTQLQALQTQVSHLYKRLRHPQDRLREQAQQCDYLTLRLQQTMQQHLASINYQVEKLRRQLQHYAPDTMLKQTRMMLTHLHQRLFQTIEQILALKRQHLQTTCGQLHAYSPLQTLQRGYSITQKEDNTVIKQYNEVQPNDSVQVTLSKGKLYCTVNTVSKR